MEPQRNNGSLLLRACFPGHERLLLSPQLPPRDATRRDPHDLSGAVSVRIKFRVMQEPADKCRQLVLPHGSHDDRIVLVPKFWCVEAQVTREERRLTEAAQQDHDLFVL